MKVTVNSTHSVAFWRWNLTPNDGNKIRVDPNNQQVEAEQEAEEEEEEDDDDDVCGICRIAFDGCCPDCKTPGDECPLIWGECTHVFHMHCLLKWINTESSKSQCPMDRKTWSTNGWGGCVNRVESYSPYVTAFRGSHDALSAVGSVYGTTSPQNTNYFGVPQRSHSPGYSMRELGGGGGGRPGSMAFTTGSVSQLRTVAPGRLPSDDVIVADIQSILAQANLQTLTKKGVRQELEAMYGIGLGEKKVMVNNAIEVALGLV